MKFMETHWKLVKQYEDGLINQNKIEELPVKIQGIYNELVIRSNQS